MQAFKSGQRPSTVMGRIAKGFSDPEITFRMDKKYHIGFVVCADSPERVEALLTDYRERIARDFQAVLPPADRPVA